MTAQSMLVSGTALLILGSGCVQDKSVQDFQNEQMNEQISQIQALSGTYRGNLISSKDQSVLGAMELELDPDVSVSTSGPTTQGQASLVGVVTLHGQNTRQLVFQSGYLDYVANNFKLDTPVQQRNGIAEEIELLGQVSGDTVTGKIDALGYDAQGATFTLTKNAPLPSSQALSREIKPQPGLNAVTQTFSATATFPKLDTPNSALPMEVDLIFFENETDSDQEFLKLFTPIQIVDVGLTFDPTNTDMAFLFQNAELDPVSGVLSSSAKVTPMPTNSSTTTDSSNIESMLTCKVAGADPTLSGWTCTYVTNTKLTIFKDLTFLPKNTQTSGT